MFKKILNPDLYHGHNKKKNFFEGWYFKISDLKGENTFAFIPGIFLGEDHQYSHSFIQVVDGSNIKYDYLKYNKEDFRASKDSFDIKVDKSNFSLNGISLDIDRPETKIKGKVRFHNVKKWPDTFINPGSMGFYNYLTFMQCYSQVCAMDIKLKGKLNINGQNISFDDGKGYIEKNWGKEFPHSWIWVQGNQFKNHSGSISCSIGHIPFLLGNFRGFLIGLMVDDDFYTFTTMNKSKIKIKQREEDVEIKVENKNYILNINVLTKKEKFMTLKGPRDDKMVPLVNENLGGIVEVQLIDIKSNKEIFKDTTICGGIEYGGDQMLILDGR